MSNASPSHRLLIVGCGDIGSRHLQAVATLPEVRAIDVVDPRPAAHAMAQQRLAEVSGRRHDFPIRWLTTLDDAQPEGSLCIVATQAEGRSPLMQEIVTRCGYTTFLVEKLVTQSIAEYEELLAFAAAHGVRGWVNCKTRAYPFHQRAKQCLDATEPIMFQAAGGNYGVATTGIHLVDLFLFYDESSDLQLDGAFLDPVLHPSKRGATLFDLSGTIVGHTPKGSRFIVSFAKEHKASLPITLVSPRYRCIVDDVQRWAVESDERSGWVWRRAPFEGNLLISAMTAQFVRDILTTGTCHLPTLHESFAAHRVIFAALQSQFTRLLEREATLCPVT